MSPERDVDARGAAEKVGEMWKIAHRPYALPFRVVVRTAHGPWARREGFLVRVELAGEAHAKGGAGWGEVAPIPWFGTESLAEAAEALASLRGAASDLGDALARVPQSCVCVRAALAAAWADAEPRAESAVKVLPLAGLLPAGRGVRAVAAAKLELGYRTFKWKVGATDDADERALLDDLLGDLPAGAKLRLDANGAWERRTAERWLELAAERPQIDYIEQPISAEARGAEDTLRGLAEDYPVKIALDESIAGARDVERWLAADWRGVWVIKPALLGEPEPVLARLAKARADVVFGSALETGVGAKAGLRLAFAWAQSRPAGERRALGYGVWPLFEDKRAEPPQGGGPFVRLEDVARMDAEALWNALP
ncbi:MAG: o-succinylbenzoate synthase [Opitutaceae bacterium]|jgi:O-succinylbenzoate synthase|nr:o-succinylbenzoate synthase [Opitutaceae bacterium]